MRPRKQTDPDSVSTSVPDMDDSSKRLRAQYRQAVESGDLRAQLHVIEALAGEQLKLGETLSVPRLVEEGLAILMKRKAPFTKLERLQIGLRLLRLWAASGSRDSESPDPSKYWFFHT